MKNVTPLNVQKKNLVLRVTRKVKGELDYIVGFLEGRPHQWYLTTKDFIVSKGEFSKGQCVLTTIHDGTDLVINAEGFLQPTVNPHKVPLFKSKDLCIMSSVLFWEGDQTRRIEFQTEGTQMSRLFKKVGQGDWVEIATSEILPLLTDLFYEDGDTKKKCKHPNELLHTSNVDKTINFFRSINDDWYQIGVGVEGKYWVEKLSLTEVLDHHEKSENDFTAFHMLVCDIYDRFRELESLKHLTKGKGINK